MRGDLPYLFAEMKHDKGVQRLLNLICLRLVASAPFPKN